MMYNFGMYSNGPGMFPLWGPLFIIMALWSIFWKGLALWHAARRGEHWWFLAVLLLNTAGILEIIYLFAFAKLKFEDLFTMVKKPGTPSAPKSTPPPAAPPQA